MRKFCLYIIGFFLLQVYVLVYTKSSKKVMADSRLDRNTIVRTNALICKNVGEKLKGRGKIPISRDQRGSVTNNYCSVVCITLNVGVLPISKLRMRPRQV